MTPNGVKILIGLSQILGYPGKREKHFVIANRVCGEAIRIFRKEERIASSLRLSLLRCPNTRSLGARRVIRPRRLRYARFFAHRARSRPHPQ